MCAWGVRTRMKALSVPQPSATLIAIGAKRIETTAWHTRYRGPLAIHASKSHLPWGFPFHQERLIVGVLGDHFRLSTWRELLERLPRGAVIATASLVACISTEVLTSAIIQPRLSERELMFGDFSGGGYGWLLEDVKELPDPIPVVGRRGLWEWIPEEMQVETSAL